ncbi:hypothetical protein [Brevundimonas sp. G8]|uniref:hypothetical protein n=1 Tax=Brevundimonas sp. G8 TaxID=1350776 RepID=UPI0012F0F881|nr:hypothetical protein [Brevundimonas sp. G8]VXB47885.1 conserved exported hypothetical protein [Brevundimonas sp. G8]
MRLVAALLLILPTLAACGDGEKAAPQATSAPKASATAEVEAAPVSKAVAPADLQSACRDVVNRMFGQGGDAVTFKANGEQAAEVSWRAPVDGGVLKFECRADGDGVGLFRDGQPMSVDVQMAAPAAKQEAR